MKCCPQAKLALPLGGTPYCQRTSSSTRCQSESLKGGLAMTNWALRSLCRSRRKASACGTKIGLDAANGEVHDSQAAGGGIAFLAVDAQVTDAAAVFEDEL